MINSSSRIRSAWEQQKQNGQLKAFLNLKFQTKVYTKELIHSYIRAL